MLRIVVQDLATGETETTVVPGGEYVIVTSSPCHVSHTQVYAGGKTVVVTIKDRVAR